LKKIKNGFFITVEGIDGSGKSSLVNFLSSALFNLDFDVIKTREPGGTWLGAELREIIIGGALGTSDLSKLAGQSQPQEFVKHMKNALPTSLAIDSTELGCPGQRGLRPTIDRKAEFLLFAADRAQHVYALINPGLNNGSIVISDRGSYSSLAYQGYGKGLDREMISSVNSWVVGTTKPDMVIYLKIDYNTAIKRVLDRGEKITSFEKKGEEFFNKVINGFNELFYLRSQEVPDSIMTIDASQSAEKVNKEVLDKILPIIMLKERI